jgi:hypothetical protein
MYKSLLFYCSLAGGASPLLRPVSKPGDQFCAYGHEHSFFFTQKYNGRLNARLIAETSHSTIANKIAFSSFE